MRYWLGGLAALVLAAVVVGALSVSHLEEGTSRQGAQVVHFKVDSAILDRTLRETAVIPPATDGRGRPLLVFLHGRGSNEDSNLDGEMFAALQRQGKRAPVIVFPYGGDHSYWHDRDDGDWRAYLDNEVIPQAQERFGTDTARVAVGGISMGGFGAYDFALHSKRRLCAVGGHSPALWAKASQTAPGAFDDVRDFAHNDVIGVARSHPRRFARQPLWLDAGTRDPFDPGDRAFVAALRDGHVPIKVRHWPGAHQRSYWRAHWGSYIRFYATALARCG
ncbi:MAG TPA: alpha/beta hydrolase-fold protein [Thermoleophilaceae bacterium]|jgi:S-formylglutathione hydrolase FrmB